MATDTDLRSTFNTVAKLYHAIRPRYPEALFDALIQTTRLDNDATLLEIGVGTGQATEAFAKRGYEIVAIELGDALVEVGQNALAKYPNVQFINAPFETVDLPANHFDLVYSATAFHWIDPEHRFRKPYQLLKSDGHMAIIGTTHISDEAGDDFFYASQPIYQTYKPGGKSSIIRLPRLSELEAYDVDDSLFEVIYFNTFTHEVLYSGREYAQLLNMYSPILSLDTKSRSNFLGEIQTLIETKFDDRLLKRYAFTLTIAKKKPVQ